MRVPTLALLALTGVLMPVSQSNAQVNRGVDVYVPPTTQQGAAPNPRATVNGPVQYVSPEQMDDIWRQLDANGPVERRPVSDPNEDQASNGGDNGISVPHRRRVRCFYLTPFEWFLVTRENSEFGGTVCARR